MQLDNRVPWVETTWMPLIMAGADMCVAVIAKTMCSATETRISAEPAAIALTDVHAEGEDGPLCVPSDLCAYKPGTDVVLGCPPEPERRQALTRRTIGIHVGPVDVRRAAGGAAGLFPWRRDHPQRRPLGGTYDANWLRERMPLLPIDFDPRFHQAAPHDMVAVPWLLGGETLRVAGLYPQATDWSVRLPAVRLVLCGHVRNHYFSLPMRLDTVLIDPTTPRLSLVWRCAIGPLRKIEDLRALFLYAVRPQIARDVFAFA